MTSTTEQTTGEQTTGQIVWRDPRVLAAHPLNVRTNLGNIDGLAASIAEVGVLEPIILIPTEHGEVIVAGWRRTHASIKAEVFLVPCVLRPDLAGDIDTITSMVVENVHREGLSDVALARAYEQLAGFGLSAPQIAKRTGIKQKSVKEHLVVAGSDLAVVAGERYSFLTLEHLMVLAEFEDDKAAVKELTVTAKQDLDYFEHLASQLRRKREREATLAKTVATLTEARVTIIDDPGWSPSGPMERLDYLVNDKDKKITTAAHACCAGHVASIDSYDPERVTYWCTDPTNYGHKSVRVHSSTTNSSDRGTDGKLTEEARAHRRRVIDNNKAMDAAIPVRRAFVANLVTRKSAPKGMLRFVVDNLATYSQDLAAISDAGLAALVGISGDDERFHVVGRKAVADASEARLVNVAFGLVAGSIESTWGKDAWRHNHARRVAYLHFLVAQGYRLAEIEQEMVDNATEPSTVGDDEGNALDGEATEYDDEQEQEADE